MALGAHSSTAALTSGTGGGRVSLVLTADGSSLAVAQASTHPVEVTSEDGRVLSRASTHDVFIEVPSNTPKCGYDLACASTPLMLVEMQATNPHPTDFQTTRLSFSRNFETRDASLTQSGGLGLELALGIGLELGLGRPSCGEPQPVRSAPGAPQPQP